MKCTDEHQTNNQQKHNLAFYRFHYEVPIALLSWLNHNLNICAVQQANNLKWYIIQKFYRQGNIWQIDLIKSLIR